MGLLKGIIRVVNSLASNSVVDALSAAQGQALDTRVTVLENSLSGGGTALLDIKPSLKAETPSPTFPWFRLDQDHTFSSSNWPLLVPELRTIKLDVGGTSAWTVTAATKYDGNANVELTLDSSAANMLTALLESLNYFGYSYSTGDSTIDNTLVNNWNMVVKCTADIGDAAGRIAAGTEMYIKYTNGSISNTINPSTYRLGVAYVPQSGNPSDVIGTVSGGQVEIYLYRTGIVSGLSSTTSAVWRKMEDTGLYTPGAGDSVANLPRRHRTQNHSHSISHNARYDAGGGSWDWGGFNLFMGTFAASVSISGNPTTNGAGSHLVGINTRGRNLPVYLYAYGASYVI